MKGGNEIEVYSEDFVLEGGEEGEGFSANKTIPRKSSDSRPPPEYIYIRRRTVGENQSD